MEFRIFIGQESNPTRGAWVDAADAKAVEAAVAQYSDDGRHEVGVVDSEGFGNLRGSVDELRILAEYLVDADDADARLAYAQNTGETDPEAIASGFEDAYCGTWDSEEAFTEETFRDRHDIPSHLDAYIDWEAMARDLFICDYFSVDDGNGSVYVFRSI